MILNFRYSSSLERLPTASSSRSPARIENRFPSLSFQKPTRKPWRTSKAPEDSKWEAHCADTTNRHDRSISRHTTLVLSLNQDMIQQITCKALIISNHFIAYPISATPTYLLDLCIGIDSGNILVRSKENRNANVFARFDTIADICLAISGMMRLVVGENSIPRYINRIVYQPKVTMHNFDALPGTP